MTATDLEKWSAARAHHLQYEDASGRQAGGPFSEVDMLGRTKLRRIGLPTYLLTVARSEPARVRRVPASAIAQDGDDDVGEFSLVACPCGAKPVVRSKLEKCVDCERYYVHIELGSVYVCYGAMEPPPLQ